ncbi:hypothetical protein C3509_24015 [Salmonella enterica]|nr:hypothetical protein [Salmonella enterica]ECE3295120.1 hypothetical protein [Salmonella enterica]ECG1137051.1 hypothetical protein [Salmonella enterica subsp. enterica]
MALTILPNLHHVLRLYRFPFSHVHYILIYHTVTSLAYVFVPLDLRPLNGKATPEAQIFPLHCILVLCYV